MSPTTLRYLKVASDLKKYFGQNFGDRIAEIGGGYGGQLLVLDSVYSFTKYKIFDIIEVNKLIKKYLESFLIKGSYSASTLNQEVSEEYDLVISNYGFSEVPKKTQKMYIDKVLSHSSRGYLTMNSGMEKENRQNLSIEKLRRLLPEFDIVEEKPKTGSNNYIIIWDQS